MKLDAQPEPWRPRRSFERIGFAGAGIQLALAIALLVLVNQVRDTVEPPEPVSRGLALGLIYALPAIIGGLGAWSGWRPLLAAAAIACAVGSVVSFSGVTLLFLIPGLLFGVAAATVRAASRPPVAAAARSNPIGGVALAIVLVLLMVGSGISLLALTEARCWVAEQTPTGIVYRIVPDIGGVSLQSKGESAGCSSAVLTVRGAAVAALLGLGAVGLAVAAVVRRRRLGSLEIVFLQMV